MHILLVNNKAIAVSENMELLKQRAYSYFDDFDNSKWFEDGSKLWAEKIQHGIYVDNYTTFVIESIEYLSTQE